jgi:soluble lytic murein transglycosylase
MKALYQGGRCHAAKNEPEKALALFQRAEQAHPSHSYADDARLRAAEMYDALAARARAADGGVAAGDALSQQGLKLLANLADKFPSGDVRSEALFRVFFAAWKAGNLDEAARALDTSLAKVPREEGWWDAGRTLYWIGRVADKQGRAADARAAWSRCAREYPLSYYALAALNRLREQSPDEAAKLCAALERPPPTAKDLAWRFAPRPLFGEPAFLRGVELARLGLGADAKRELAAAGIHAPEKGAKVDPSGEELLWLATVLYDRAGDWALSHWIPRHTLTDYSRTWPTGENRKRWLLSYPRGYAELIGPNARKCGQPEALEFAIVREESAFDPLTESFANAVGLTQLTQAPAKRFAEGLPYSREALRDPAINVAIGARELGELWQRYSGGAAFVIAGYNAGEHRVQQWLRAAPPGQPLDEWIESIPFDETRGYTKRVLSSWFAYHWLYRGASADPLPPLPNTLPKR